MRFSGCAAAILASALSTGCRDRARQPDVRPHDDSDGGVPAAAAPAPEPEPETAAVPAAPPAPDGVGPFLVLLGGDLMLPPQVQEVARLHGGGDLAAGYAWLLREIAPVRRSIEALGRVVFVANLESPIATERVPPTSSPPVFNGSREALDGFRRAGVDVVTMANNHAFDQGREGLGETIAAAKEAGLGVAGAGTAADARRPAVLSDAAPRVLLLAYAMTVRRPRDPPGEAEWRIATLDGRVEADVREARAAADILIVTVHWVGEFVSTPYDGWRDWARSIAGWGADAVVGHGPHVLGPVEVFDASGRRVPIVYSLGNLVANMGWEVHPGAPLAPGDDSRMRMESREQALAALRIDQGTAGWAVSGLWIVPLWLEDNRPIANRPGGPPREVFPRPMPWCVPMDPAAGCFRGAGASWCRGRLDMILRRRVAALRTLWGTEPQPLEPCPPGADPYAPQPDFRPL